MNTKILRIFDENTDCELTVFVNTNNKIVLNINYESEFIEPMLISLDKEDTLELIKELKKLINHIKYG